VIPKGIVSTGFPAVRDTCCRLRIVFDPWQDGAGTAILGKREDRLYAADAVVMSIPRQVGKTFLVGSIVLALCIINPRTTAIWTAHRYPTAEDTFNDLKALAERVEMKPHIRRIYDSAGKQRIMFTNGSRLLFGARERGFGRGFKRVGVLIFDEAQILTDNAVDDMIPATNRHPNPLIFYMGTPPKPSDPSDHFQRLRNEAISGESEGTLYIEMSADEGADPNDREQWAKANPSYPIHTPARSVLRMKKNLGSESFLREGLGIWDGATSLGVFSLGAWARCAVDTAPPPVAGLGVAADLDQVWASLAAASEGDRPHLGSVLRVRLDRGRDHFVSEVARIQSQTGVAVGIDVKGPASFLIDDLLEAGVELARASVDDFVQACADLRTAVETAAVEHGNYTDLNDAVDAAGWRKLGERRVFARKSGDISALESAALGLWVARLDYDVMESFA
jgi:hypothetical protein